MKKALYLLIMVSLLLPGVLRAAEVIGHYSNMRISPDSGDCGGYQVWLAKKGQSLGGELAAYEGDCGPEKKKLEDVTYDPKTGALSFKAPYLSDDFYCTFKGTLKKDRLSGTISIIEKKGNVKTHSEKVNLVQQ